MVLTAANAYMHFEEISKVYYSVFTLLMMAVYIVFFLKPELGITKQQIRYSVVFLITAMVLLLFLKYIPRSLKLGERRIRTYAFAGNRLVFDPLYDFCRTIDSCRLSVAWTGQRA